MRPKASAATPSPKRLVCVFSPDGFPAEHWATSERTGALSLGPALAGPMKDHAKDLIAVRGLLDWDGATNHPEFAATFTATKGDRNISLDQVVADEIAGDTRRSLTLGVWGAKGGPGQSISYAGPARPRPVTVDPMTTFKELFSNGTPMGMAEVSGALARRRSVLDIVKRDFDSLIPSLSGADRSRLSDHADQIRSLENRLMVGTTPAPQTCSAPTTGALDLESFSSIPKISELQIELIAHAFACDLTRVATLQFAQGPSDQVYSWVPTRQPNWTIHQHGHESPIDDVIKLHSWDASQVAFLIKRLKDEGVFENTLVVWGTELARGNHGPGDRAFLMAGSLGGHYRTGRVENFSTTGYVPPLQSRNYFGAFLLNIAQAFGSKRTSFGDSYFCQGGPTPIEQGGWA